MSSVRDWRRWLAAALLLLFVGAIATHRELALAVAREVAALPAAWVAVLAVATTALVVANGVLASTITAGLSPTRGVMVQQATTAANNTAIGSGPVSLGLRIAMLRSWRISDLAIGITVVTLNVVAAYKLWVFTLMIALLGSTGVADGVISRTVFHLGAIVAATVLAGSTVFWWSLLRHPGPLRWVARTAQRPFDAVRRRLARRWQVPAVDLPELTDRFRTEATALSRQRGGRIVAAAVVEQLIFIAMPVLVVRAFGIGPDVVSTTEVLVTFGVIRVAAALTPVPGGIGITEVGTTALLTRFGGPESTVIAAVLTFRTLTFLLPMVIGSACVVLWRREQRRTSGSAGEVLELELDHRPGVDVGEDAHRPAAVPTPLVVADA